ncbi:hypothetical protein V8E54_008428 [Elaphomyces granulatus]
MDLGTAVGVVSFGIQICGTLINFYQSYRHAGKDIEEICTQITDLQNTLRVLQDTLEKHPFSPDAIQVVKDNIQSCEGCNQHLRKELEIFGNLSSPPTGLRQQFISRGKRLLYPFKESTLAKLRGAITEMRDNVFFAIQALLLETSGSTKIEITTLGKQVSLLTSQSKEIEKSVSQTGALLHQTRSEETRQKVENWLNPVDVSLLHKVQQDRQQEGTGQWLLKSPSFATWKSQPMSFLWVRGIPGAGKSVLCSVVIDHLNKFCREEKLGLGYFYFSFNDQRRKNVRDDLLRTLIYQFWKRLDYEYDGVEGLCALCKREDRCPTLNELERLLQDLFRRSAENYIAIDGLDECSQREDLLETIALIAGWQIRSLHMVVSSRVEDGIEEVLKPLVTDIVRVEDHNSQDIRLYLNRQLKKDIRLKTWSEEIKEEIETSLVSKANGMFLLVSSLLQLIRDKRKLPDLRKALNFLPDQLFGAFRRILEMVSKDDEKDLRKILSWLAFSERPLSLTEAAEVVAIAEDDTESPPLFVDPNSRYRNPREVLGVCSSLVNTHEVVWSRDTQYAYETVEVVVLAHASVKDFLVSEHILRSTVSKFWLSAELSHMLISEHCLAYLLQFDDAASLSESTFQDWPLAQYAAQYWPIHARRVRPDMWSKRLEELSSRLLRSQTCFVNSLRIWDVSCEAYCDITTRPANAPLPPPHPVCFAAGLGLLPAVNLLLRQNPDSATESNMRAALHFAAKGDCDDPLLVATLIDCGADVNSTDEKGRTPIHHAAAAGNLDSLAVFLDHGAQTEARDSDGMTALHQAVLRGGADVEAKNHLGETAMHLNTYFPEHATAVLEVLLQYGANIDSRDDTGMTPLIHAAEDGTESLNLVETLLQNSANVDLADDEGYSPLHRVCFHWNCCEMVEVLLRYGADVDRKTMDKETALHLALQNSEPSVKTVELLLTHGARINATNEDGRTPLHIAAEISDPLIGPDIITFLLSHGADIDAKNLRSETAVDTAMLHACGKNVELLLAKGARPTPKDKVEQYSSLNFADLMVEAETNVAKEAEAATLNTGPNERIDNGIDVIKELNELHSTLATDGLNRELANRLNSLMSKLPKRTTKNKDS